MSTRYVQSVEVNVLPGGREKGLVLKLFAHREGEPPEMIDEARYVEPICSVPRPGQCNPLFLPKFGRY